MVAIVFANLIAHKWYGRSLYDNQLAARGIDLSMGRERAYLMHHKVIDHVTNALPVVTEDSTIAQLRQKMADNMVSIAVVVDRDSRYLGQLFQHQLQDLNDEAELNTIEYERGNEFDENTSIWDAMHKMRDFIGEAIAVVDSSSGRYLGAIPEAVAIDAYLEASQKLRREEHEV